MFFSLHIERGGEMEKKKENHEKNILKHAPIRRCEF